jgi:hypothetical protein
VTLRSSRGAVVATRDVRVRPGARVRVELRLSAAETHRLRRGRYVVSAALVGADGRVGNVRTAVLRVTAR